MDINDYLNAEQAAKCLGIAKGTLYGLCHKKQITYHKPGGKLIFFHKQDLAAYMSHGTVVADFEVNRQAEGLLNAR